MEKLKFLALPGLELRPLGRPVRGQSLYRLHYSESCKDIMQEQKYGRKFFLRIYIFCFFEFIFYFCLCSCWFFPDGEQGKMFLREIMCLNIYCFTLVYLYIWS
jgi:hypothetical protein